MHGRLARWSTWSVCDVGSASFSNPYIASPTSQHILQSFRCLPSSQLILQPFRCFTYIIGTSPASPGKPPMPLWCLIYPWWFCNLQWLRPAGLYERCKLALELKRLKTSGLKLPDICLTGEEKPRKNLSQETCPDRGSIPGPLRDRRACYRLAHSEFQRVKALLFHPIHHFIHVSNSLGNVCRKFFHRRKGRPRIAPRFF